MWRRLLTSSPLIEKALEAEAIARFNTIYRLNRIKLTKLLKRYDTLIGVSKAIPYEMGGEWIDRIISLDPGVSLDENDLSVIASIKSKIREKKTI